MNLRSARLDELEILERETFRRIALYRALEEVVRNARYRFQIVEGRVGWDRVLFLNATYWSAAHAGDVLASRKIPADVVAHVAWHHLAERALGATTVEAMLLGESVASAFDLYLVGRLLVLAPRSSFLATQVDAMAEAARFAGLPARGFARLLREIAADPDRAFESLRALLFATSCTLVRARSPAAAVRILDRCDAHPMAPLLHHYALSNWILHARAHGTAGRDRAARRVDASLASARDPLGWLEERWIWCAARVRNPREKV